MVNVLARLPIWGQTWSVVAISVQLGPALWPQLIGAGPHTWPTLDQSEPQSRESGMKSESVTMWLPCVEERSAEDKQLISGRSHTAGEAGGRELPSASLPLPCTSGPFRWPGGMSWGSMKHPCIPSISSLFLSLLSWSWILLLATKSLFIRCHRCLHLNQGKGFRRMDSPMMSLIWESCQLIMTEAPTNDNTMAKRKADIWWGRGSEQTSRCVTWQDTHAGEGSACDREKKC